MPFDPTHTGKLRQMFRGEAQRKIRTLLTASQDMLVNQEALGNLHHPMMLVSFFRQQLPSAAGVQLEIFTRWFYQMTYSTVVQQGTWLQEHARRAHNHGLKAGEKWSGRAMLSAPDDVYYKFYTNELEGIADATVQQVTRAISAGLINREGARKLYRRVVAVTMKVLEPRMYGLGHQIIVQQHNLGRLAQLREVGYTHVGLIPEHLPRSLRLPRRDALHDQEEVHILTAGDDEVCEECEDIAEAGPYPIEEAESLIPAHLNCRCAFVPTEDRRFALNLARTIEELEAEE